jgi:hypothetical protein
MSSEPASLREGSRQALFVNRASGTGFKNPKLFAGMVGPAKYVGIVNDRLRVKKLKTRLSILGKSF